MKVIRISRAAEEIGCSPNTLRNWERRGLIQIRRDVNGRRFFSQREIDEIEKRIFLNRNQDGRD
jgi:MerR family transcriptional regulator, copper efflux regulator